MAVQIHERGPTENDGDVGGAERPLNVLVIHEILPHPDRHGADVQWMQMLRELRVQGHKVLHVARTGANRERYAAGVKALGIPVYAPDAERMRFLGLDLPVEWTFEQLLSDNQFDLAILFHWFWNGISIPEHYMEEIWRCSPKTFIAVLSDDQQGVREKQMAELTGQWSDYERSHDFTSREFQVYRRADVVLTISEDDRNAFLRVAPELVTGRMPMIASVGPEGGTFSEHSGFLFLANFDNPANRDASDWMLAEIWPRIRAQLPGADLALVGNNLPADLGVAEKGVLRVGYVADLGPIFAKCRVALSPVRFGTGIKTKNLSALAHAVPLVTTTVGADGMALRNLIDRARHTKAKAYDPDFTWPYLLVEKRFPEIVNGEPAGQRLFLRMARYTNRRMNFLSDTSQRGPWSNCDTFSAICEGACRRAVCTCARYSRCPAVIASWARKKRLHGMPREPSGFSATETSRCGRQRNRTMRAGFTPNHTHPCFP